MQVDTVRCQYCSADVLQKCMMIHERACLKNFKEQKHEKGFFSKLLSPSKIQSESEEMIPCTQCGESVPFSIFAMHQDQCVGHQLTKCHQCQILFPIFLFDQHLQVCTGPTYQPPANNSLLKIFKPPEPQMIFQPQINHSLGMPQIPKPQPQKVQKMIPEDDDSEDEVLVEMIAALAKRQIENQKLSEDPLSAKQLKKLQQVKLNSVEECSICCCQMNKKSNHIKLNCSHKFHKKCINSWLSKNPFCPMCRQHALKQ